MKDSPFCVTKLQGFVCFAGAPYSDENEMLACRNTYPVKQSRYSASSDVG